MSAIQTPPRNHLPRSLTSLRKPIKETNIFFHPGQQDCALATQKAALQTPSGSGQVCQRRLSCEVVS
ncbi:hypothetical protein SLE2022_112370 [Rubroshorea leprosula]